jgi:histidinol-phosphate aminotransferase
MEVEKLVRENVKGFSPYIAGKPIDAIKRELNLKTVIKLASNENNLGPSKRAVLAIRKAAGSVYAYPDSNSYLLKEALSEKYNLPVENIFVGAGGDEIIEILGKIFFNQSDEIIISKHSFIRYEMAVKLMNAKAIIIDMKDGLMQNLEAMAAACTPKTKAIFITNPNNPTGTYNNREALGAFLNAVPVFENGNKPLIILDEAYFEYGRLCGDYPDGLDFLSAHDNLIVFRTFSKAYALAGLRVGYGFAHKDIVNYYERVRPPFDVNSLASAAAIASLKDGKQVPRAQKLVEDGKKYLYSEFDKLGIEYIKTAANFILISVRGLNGKNLFNELLKKGVIIRAVDEYDLPTWARVSIGLKHENKFFIDKLKEVIGQ